MDGELKAPQHDPTPYDLSKQVERSAFRVTALQEWKPGTLLDSC